MPCLQDLDFQLALPRLRSLRITLSIPGCLFLPKRLYMPALGYLAVIPQVGLRGLQAALFSSMVETTNHFGSLKTLALTNRILFHGAELAEVYASTEAMGPDALDALQFRSPQYTGGSGKDFLLGFH
ncbi:hypothetical protein FOMPIDRAFT_85605 [Fomitopsis schrenkii]|uniref:Uncharacterized protein n=1 Tax=Fomitopsis schrenkii TaxID=2126942 RepID=S8EIP3_FOMSC|nr:hypothetical protein FOMPIDRAFT_85605 [Fomitopsis schrenkii]